MQLKPGCVKHTVAITAPPLISKHRGICDVFMSLDTFSASDIVIAAMPAPLTQARKHC